MMALRYLRTFGWPAVIATLPDITTGTTSPTRGVGAFDGNALISFRKAKSVRFAKMAEHWVATTAIGLLRQNGVRDCSPMLWVSLISLGFR
jgi:hypothetical protein